MPLKFCLPPAEAEKFKNDVASGEIAPEALADMTSTERRAFFAKRFGDALAEPMNTAIEEKLLLKNQRIGLSNWARRMGGGEKNTAKRDIISKIKNMEKLLTPKDEDAFLADLASHRLGTRISYEEAQKITELSDNVDDTKAKMAAGGERLEYGRAVVALRNYVGGLKGEAEKMTMAETKRAPVAAAGRALSTIAGNAKSLKASMDNSALFRQGWRTLLTHPGIWQNNARQSFVNLVKAFGANTVMDEVNADIYSRPTYDLMQAAGLSVGVKEETFPESFAEKVPVLGRAYRASEHAYNAFVRKTRADVFDKYLEIAKRSGVDLTDKDELQSIGKLVNSLTGRGHLGPIEPVANVINNVFFSPRMMKSTFDTLTLHSTDRMSGFARKQAAINLTKILVGTAAILGIAKAVNSKAVDFDPRSANFGKIRVGNTRYDMTGGMSGMATLAARLLTMSSKSSITGKVNPINSGKFGATTGTDLVYNFFENKLSPAAAVVKDVMKGKTFERTKPTIGNEAVNLFVPLPITNAMELKKDRKTTTANMITAMLADALGISTNTYDSNKRP